MNFSLKYMPLPSEGGHPLLLPPDYDDLTLDGQRYARLNACMQWWFKHPSPSAAAESLLASFQLFHSYYLRSDPENEFHSRFFDDDPLPFAPFHYDIIRANAMHPLAVVGAPRGSAKSTLLEQIRLLKVVSKPSYSITTCFGGSAQKKKFGARFIIEIDSNSRINDDFGIAFGGKLRPPRGKAPFSTDMAFLSNGSWLSHTTTGSFQRGDRPKEYHLDDPEYDPEGESTSMERLRAELERLLFKHIYFMVTREGRRLTWLGTTISRAHLLHKALQNEGEGFGFDKRFSSWDRKRLRALYALPSGEEASIWPEMWSVEKLHRIKEEAGAAYFRSEMQNDPGTGEGSYFFLDDRHGYFLSDLDDAFFSEPHSSRAVITWYRKGEKISMPISEFLSKYPCFIPLDSAPTSNATSDFNAMTVLAVTPYNELFVLDVYNRRVKEHVAALEALRLADKWKASCIAVELHSKSQGIYGSLQHLLGTKAESIEDISHLPALMPLRVGYAAKTARISAMYYRFGDPNVTDPTVYSYGGLIKLPLHAAHFTASTDWQALATQIEQFNPDAPDGGLENDDALDTLSMSQDVIRSLKRKPSATGRVETPLDLLSKGVLEDKAGLPIAHQIDWTQVDAQTRIQIFDSLKERSESASTASKL